jgi:ADP-ribose pyrophosphatase
MEPDSSEVVWRGKLLGLTIERWGENEREIVEHPGAVAIVSIDTEGEMAFVRQLREATRGSLLEIPAGTAEPGEECGLTGGQWSKLGAFWTTPGFSREYMHVFLAEGVERGDPAPEADEELEIVRYPAADVEALVPEIEDAKTLAGLLLYLTSRATTHGR